MSLYKVLEKPSSEGFLCCEIFNPTAPSYHNTTASSLYKSLSVTNSVSMRSALGMVKWVLSPPWFSLLLEEWEVQPLHHQDGIWRCSHYTTKMAFGGAATKMVFGGAATTFKRLASFLAT